MTRKLIFIILPLIALLLGLAGGAILREQPTEETETISSEQEGGSSEDQGTSERKAEKTIEQAWFKFSNQFFIPLMKNGQVSSTMILTLSLELPKTAQDSIRNQEHRLRDALLRALMIHANTGGFDGNFTVETQMTKLRASLLAAAREVAGDDILDVLIEDIARQ